jgi:outer membrane protein OmpA-like peptidoglycan-associated protein
MKIRLIKLTLLGKILCLLITVTIITCNILLINERPSKVGSTQPNPPIENLIPTIPSTKSETQVDENVLSITVIVNYGPDAAELTEEDRQKLDNFINIALKFNNVKIRIEGNISADGELDQFGKDLSLQRAQVIADYFKSKGIDESRLILISNLDSKPLPNTEPSDPKNRRADISFDVKPLN